MLKKNSFALFFVLLMLITIVFTTKPVYATEADINEQSSSQFVPPKVFLDGYEYDCPPPRLINGTLVLGLYMTNSGNDYVFIESGHVLTYFYPGSRKVDVYKAHVNSAGLTEKMDFLESFEMDIDPIFCWNKAHDRIDYVMVPLKLYAKAAVCKVEYDREKNIINIDRGISMNIACSGITSEQKPIYNAYSAFSKSEDIYVYYKTTYPIRAETLVSVFTYGIGNRWEEVYREDIVAKDKDCFCIKLPKGKLELPQYLDKGNGAWLHYLKTTDDRQVSLAGFNVVPTGKQSYMYLYGVKKEAEYWLDYEIINYANPSSGEYTVPCSKLKSIRCEALALSTANRTQGINRLLCLNRDNGSVIYKIEGDAAGSFHAPLKPLPGHYEFALYTEGEYQNSVYLTVTDN